MHRRDEHVRSGAGTLLGLLGGSALVLGAALAYLARVPPRVVAAVMAFGSGVLISALSFDLMEEAMASGAVATAAGFLAGAAVYTAANVVISRSGGHHRKRSGDQQQKSNEGGGVAIAVGALLDGIPESIVIGVSLLSGQGVSMVAVAAVFLSNVPEGLSSAAGMRRAAVGQHLRGLGRHRPRLGPRRAGRLYCVRRRLTGLDCCSERDRRRGYPRHDC